MAHTLLLRAGSVLTIAVAAAACGNDSSVPAGITRATAAATARPAVTLAPARPVVPAATAATGDPAVEPWAAALCDATARFDDAVAAVQDGIDPGALPLPERVARAQTRYRAYLEALVVQASLVAAISPPAAAAPYHLALRAQISELTRLFTEQEAQIDRVVIASEIEDANAALQREVAQLEHSLALVRSILPEHVLAALTAPVRCSVILG